MKRNRVNMLTVINAASNITMENINGRTHIVVRGVVPIVDDIVMNGRFYPSAEIKKSFNTLERVSMPLGHPKFNGRHISANDPMAVNEFHVGAWLQNVNHADGRVSGDMYVDRRYAEGSEKGKRLLQRLDDMAAKKDVAPIHISTGLDYKGIAANGESKGKRYREIATNLLFDHTAILLDEQGAGTPKEGVGIFVNADGSESEIELVNLDDADTPDPADPPLTQLLNQLKALFSVNTQEDEKPMKTMIVNALKAAGKATDNLTDDQLFQAYNEQLAADAKKKQEEDAKKKKEEEDKKKNPTVNNDEVPAWAKVLVDKVDTLSTQFAANNDKDLGMKRAAVKAKFQLTDSAVNTMDGPALDEMYAKTITAAPLNPGFVFDVNSKDDQWKDYDMNANFEDEGKK